MAWCPPESTYSQDPQNGNPAPSLSGSSHLPSTEFHSVTEDYTDAWSFLYSDAKSQPNHDSMAASVRLSSRLPSPPIIERTTPRRRRVRERCFHACPWREKEKAQGAKEFSCRGCRAETLGEVRRHAERAHHVSFIRLCPTCNRHFLDQNIFEAEHGNDGRRCEDPRKQARGIAATRAQWRELYDMIDVHVPNQAAGSVSNLVVSKPGDTATAVSSMIQDSGILPSSATREYFHNPYDDEFHGNLNTFPNLSLEPGANSYDEQWREATSACELGPDAPHASAPTRSRSHFISTIVSGDPRMDNITSSCSLSSVRGSWNPFFLSERQVEIPNTPVDNTENSPKSLSPESITEQSSSCDICGVRFLGQYSRGNLSRHKRLKHGNLEQGYPCLVAGCRKTYRRQDARLKHYRTIHPELEVEDPRRRR